jgi:hypothetical protein
MRWCWSTAPRWGDNSGDTPPWRVGTSRGLPAPLLRGGRPGACPVERRRRGQRLRGEVGDRPPGRAGRRAGVAGGVRRPGRRRARPSGGGAGIGGEDPAPEPPATGAGCARPTLRAAGSDLGCQPHRRVDEARPLWDEVFAHLPEVADGTPMAGEGAQCWLALQVKGMLCFGTPAGRRAFLESWEATDPVSGYPEEQVKGHPFGLILQALGLLHAQAWRKGSGAAEVRRALSARGGSAAAPRRA